MPDQYLPAPWPGPDRDFWRRLLTGLAMAGASGNPWASNSERLAAHGVSAADAALAALEGAGPAPAPVAPPEPPKGTTYTTYELAPGELTGEAPPEPQGREEVWTVGGGNSEFRCTVYRILDPTKGSAQAVFLDDEELAKRIARALNRKEGEPDGGPSAEAIADMSSHCIELMREHLAGVGIEAAFADDAAAAAAAEIKRLRAELSVRQQEGEHPDRRLIDLIRWALGEVGEFPVRDGRGAFYWRVELRRRFEEIQASYPPPAPRQEASGDGDSRLSEEAGNRRPGDHLPTIKRHADGGFVWTNCKSCGPDVKVDEDGCCLSCGRDALEYGNEESAPSALPVEPLSEEVRKVVFHANSAKQWLVDRAQGVDRGVASAANIAEELHAALRALERKAEVGAEGGEVRP